MKKVTTFLILFLAVVTVSAQDITGTWTGKISTMQGAITIKFNITAIEEGYTSTMDNPDQGAFGVPVDSTYFKESELTIKHVEAGLVYVGKVENDSTMTGTFTQQGYELPLNMTKKEAE
jgi:hypothetical protein